MKMFEAAASEPKAHKGRNLNLKLKLCQATSNPRTALVRQAVLGFGPAAEFDGSTPLRMRKSWGRATFDAGSNRDLKSSHWSLEVCLVVVSRAPLS